MAVCQLALVRDQPRNKSSHVSIWQAIVHIVVQESQNFARTDSPIPNGTDVTSSPQFKMQRMGWLADRIPRSTAERDRIAFPDLSPPVFSRMNQGTAQVCIEPVKRASLDAVRSDDDEPSKTMSNSGEARLATIVPYPIFKNQMSSIDTNVCTVAEQCNHALSWLHFCFGNGNRGHVGSPLELSIFDAFFFCECTIYSRGVRFVSPALLPSLMRYQNTSMAGEQLKQLLLRIPLAAWSVEPG